MGKNGERMNLLQINLQNKLKKQFKIKEFCRQDFFNYYRLYGLDDFLKQNYQLFQGMEEKVLIVNLDGTETALEQFVKEQIYNNFVWKKIENICEEDWSESQYVCFFEKNHSYNPWKIVDMVLSLLSSNESISICYRDTELDDGTVIKDISYLYWRNLQDISIDGESLIELCVSNGINLYGNLSTCLCKTALFSEKLVEYVRLSSDGEVEKLKLLYSLLKKGTIRYLNKVYVIKHLEHYDAEKENQRKQEFYEYLLTLKKEEPKKIEVSLKNEITFFYTDSSEYYNLEPLAKRAEIEGYQIRFSNNIQEKAEIGIYCQHVSCPENSKLSVILLHDMAQGHNIWPNIWKIEHWDKFDIGILPGKMWSKKWCMCASAKYARPRLGTFELGYPKADYVFSKDILQKAEQVKRKFKYDFTVLYAPSWENDGKEDDFVSTLIDLPVNLLVKQVPVAASPQFDFVRENIKKMRELHDHKYENLYYIEPDENIMVALAICDMVVSDESSVMTEASMYGKPSVAVMDWLIPDSSPSRYASVPTENVLKCKKSDLKQEVKNLLEDSEKYKFACELGMNFFSNQGNCCEDILSLIYAVKNGEMIPTQIEEKRVFPKYELIDLWN